MREPKIRDAKDFDSIEALDVAWKKLIAKSNDEDEGDLRLAHANARASFYEIRSKAAMLDVAKRDAFQRWPLALEFPEAVTGDTPAEITASVQSVHERVVATRRQEREKAQQADDDIAAARLAYGQPASASGQRISKP